MTAVNSFLTLTSRFRTEEAAQATVMTPEEVNQAAGELDLDSIGGQQAEKQSLYQSVQGAGCKVEVEKNFDKENEGKIAELEDELQDLQSDNDAIDGRRSDIQQQLEQMKQQQGQQGQQGGDQGGGDQGGGDPACSGGQGAVDNSDRIQQLEETKAEYQTELDEAEDTINESNAAIVDQTKAKEEADATIEEQTGVVEEADADLEEQNGIKNDAEETITNKTQEKAENETISTNAGARIAAIDGEIASLQPDLSATKTESDGHGGTRQVADTEKQEKARQQIEKLQQERIQKETEKQNADLAAQEAGNEIDAAEGRKTDAESAISEAENKKAEAQAQLDEAKAKKEEAESAISEAELNKTKAETDKESLQNIIAKLDEKIDKLEEDQGPAAQGSQGATPPSGQQQADNSPMIEILEGEDKRLAAQQEKNNAKMEKLEAKKEELENAKSDFLEEIKNDDMAFLVALMKEEICIKGPNGEKMSLEDVQKLIDELKAKGAKEEKEGDEAAEVGEFNIVG